MQNFTDTFKKRRFLTAKEERADGTLNGLLLGWGSAIIFYFTVISIIG